MNQEMTTTQRHINNIKSVFGGVKNWWHGKKSNKQQQEQSQAEPRQSKLRDTVENSKNERVNTSGFGSVEDDDLDKRFMASSKKQMIQPVTNSDREKEIDDNLGMVKA